MYKLIPVISFIGRHNTGKTTVLTEIVNYLTLAGYRVAVIKHSHHTLVIEPHKDSEKLYQAGADYVLACSPGVTIQYRRHEQEPSFTEICDQVPKEVDLIIVEGFKNEGLPKIEVVRWDIDPDPMLLAGTLALISDFNLVIDLPVFNFSNIEDIVNYILRTLNITT